MRWKQVYLSEPRISLKGSPCLVAGLLRIVAKIPLPLVWSKSWKPFLKLMFLFLPHHGFLNSSFSVGNEINQWIVASLPGFATFVFLVTSKSSSFLAGLSILARIRSIVYDPGSIIVHCLWLTLGSVVPLAVFFVVMFFNAFRKNAICCSPASPSSPSAQRFTRGDCQRARWPKILIFSRVTECFSRVVL